MELYQRTARLDLDNYNNDTEDGLHITSMTGSWLTIAEGFAGMRAKDGLSFAPFLPKDWTHYQFHINYRGSLILIAVNEEHVSLTLVKGEALSVRIYDEELQLKDEIKVTEKDRVRMSGTKGEKEMLKAVLFDLDGVITDTAKFHFLAWRDLGAELNVPLTKPSMKS